MRIRKKAAFQGGLFCCLSLKSSGCRAHLVSKSIPTGSHPHEWSIPLAVQNFDWHSDEPGNAEGMVEFYVYENLRFTKDLQDTDFAPEGSAEAKSEVAASPAQAQ